MQLDAIKNENIDSNGFMAVKNNVLPQGSCNV